MERKINLSVGEFYHIYSRGNNKQIIFLDDNDRNRFSKLLYVCNSIKPVVFKTIQGTPLDKIDRGKTLVNIGAYCLMPNHFHLLLHEKIENGTSLFLGKLLTAYSMYFNKRYERKGGLFDGRFRFAHADTDEYLKYLFSYIHLNPVKTIEPNWKESGITNSKNANNYLKNYTYSSYPDYVGINREEKLILNVSSFPEYFLNFKEFEQFINEWLSFKDIQGTPLDNK